MSLSPAVQHRTCAGFNRPGHDATEQDYSPNAWKRGWKYCRPCDSDYRADRKRQAGPYSGSLMRSSQPVTFNRTMTPLEAPVAPVQFSKTVEVLDADEAVEPGAATVDQTPGHEYVLDAELQTLWDTITNLTLNGGRPAKNIIFLGPAGSGKTSGAEALARRSSLPFTKVDAASMVDPESWFGTREVISQEGVSVTKYVESVFVRALQNPGVLFIDEVNRVDDEHRNVLLPILEPNGEVLNPLTGEIVRRHPHCFIIMGGNRGLMFTGISNIDPAFMTRSYTHEFNYLTFDMEMKVAIEETGVADEDAYVFARFAEDTRAKARTNEDFQPISTREVILMCELSRGGMTRDAAAKFVVLSAASSEGGAESFRQELQNIWSGVRVAVMPGKSSTQSSGSTDEDWLCPVHHREKTVPAGVSSGGRPYKAFRACPVYGCPHTEDKDRDAGIWPVKGGLGGISPRNPAASQVAASIKANLAGQKICGDCNYSNPVGVNAFCKACGATL